LMEWSRLRDVFLDEMIRLDGLGSQSSPMVCASGLCEKEGQYRCLDCFGSSVLCSGCMCATHQSHPLHRIEVNFWQKSSLHSLGLIVPLGHMGTVCPRSPTPTDLTVIDISGIHTVSVNFCDCEFACLPHRTQLLRVRWWPATLNRPQTVATFAALDTFLQLSLQSKLNMYDFYLSMVHLTDNAGVLN
ncbi:hypothetical protein BD410DRAFT_684745, partial [Rickenella mellea]